MALAFTVAALAGLAGGTALGHRMDGKTVRSAFTGMTLAVGVYLIVLNLPSLVGLVARP